MQKQGSGLIWFYTFIKASLTNIYRLHLYIVADISRRCVPQ